tara:strand:+ start:260 stop:1180 length:921 start_codon:yes stop_codon:yes gene_type:complete
MSRLRANQITNQATDGAPTVEKGLVISGVTTSTSFKGDGSQLTGISVTNITVADESTDTTCFPLYATAASGNLAPKTGSNLTFNSSSGNLRTTSLFLGTGSNESKAQDGVMIERNSGDGTAHITAGRSGGNYSGMNFYVAGASGVTLRHQVDYQSNFKWFAADGTTVRQHITSTGAVTKQAQPFVHILGITNTGGSGDANNGTATTYGPITYSAGRVTVQVEGNYLINFNTISPSGTGRIDAFIKVNGNNIVNMLTADNGSGYRQKNGSIVYHLSVNDYIDFNNSSWYSASSTGTSWKTASVYLLG